MHLFLLASFRGFIQYFKLFRSLLGDRFDRSVPHLFEGSNAPQRSAGFTLIEVMVSLAVFLIIMTSMSQIFTQSFVGYRHAKALQRDLENAQFALNLIAKELRTSTVVGFTSSKVRFYDYSQKICFEYEIAANQLTVDKKSVVGPSDDPFVDCGVMPGTPTPIAKAGTLVGQFIVMPSTQSPKFVGKVTISLQISEGPNHTAYIQTTSSLRDYGYTEL